MKFKFDRAFYTPSKVAICWTKHKAFPLEVGRYSRAGVAYSIGFYGKAAKPAWHHRHRSPEARERWITEQTESFRKSAEFKANRRAERKAFRHTLKVGDVLHTSWGYEQTNVEFFQVTELVGEFDVIVRELAQDRTETGFMSGHCSPRRGEFIGKPLRKRVCQGNSLKISDCRQAFPNGNDASGKPRETYHWSSYA